MTLSSKKINIISFCFLFLLVSFIKSEPTKIIYKGEKTLYVNSTETHQEIDIVFDPVISDISKYIKISVYKLEGDLEEKNFVISVFSNEERTNRIQMAQSIFGDPKVWITKNQLFSNNEETKIITTIECDSNPCEYYLNLINKNVIELNEEGEQINYYVTEDFTETKIKFGNIQNDSNTKMNIWAKGGMDITTKLNIAGSHSKKKNFYSFQVEQESYELTINAIKGDFVNVGSLLFLNYYAYKILTVDESPVNLFLSKGILDKACFDMQIKNKNSSLVVFGSGIIYSNIVRGYTINLNEEIQGNSTVFKYGTVDMYLSSNNIENQMVCFDFPDEKEYSNIKETILSFQLTSGDTLNGGLNIFQPQQNGILYTRFLNRGQKAAFIGHFPGANYKEINYNMLTIYGFPKMSILECEDYPLCLKFGGKNKIIPHKVNRFSSYSVYRNELIGNYSPVNFTQILLMVECEDPTGEKDINSEICSFGTLFYSEINPISLVEDQYFNQYLLINEKDSFIINFRGQNNIKKIYVDINVFAGEIKTNMIQLNGYQFKEYYNANKIYFIITINEKSNSEEVKFEVIALKNAFYSIQYSFVRDGDDSNKRNSLEPGTSYLITVKPNKQHGEYEAQKIVTFSRNNFFSKYPFLVNFYSLNCKLQIFARRIQSDNHERYDSLLSIDYFTQDLYTLEGNKEILYHDYNLTVVEEDFSDYDNKRTNFTINILFTGWILTLNHQ